MCNPLHGDMFFYLNHPIHLALSYGYVLTHLGGVYMRKLAPARVSYRDDFLISNRVYMMSESFHISLFEGTLHADKIHVWFKIANIMHVLPVPVYRQTDFTPKWVVVSCLHDTAARLRTGVKFSPLFENWGELTLGWLAPAWHFVVVSCKKYRAMRGNQSELAPGQKSPRCYVNTPLQFMFVCRSLVGAGLSQFKSDTLKFQLPFFERFRNTEDR